MNGDPIARTSEDCTCLRSGYSHSYACRERLIERLARERDEWKAQAVKWEASDRQRMSERDRLRAALEAERLLRQGAWRALERWSHDGHLQTFEDRERFRAEARALLSDEPSPSETTSNLCGNEVRIRCVQPKGHDGLHESQAGLQWAPGYAEKVTGELT